MICLRNNSPRVIEGIECVSNTSITVVCQGGFMASAFQANRIDLLVIAFYRFSLTIATPTK